MGVWKFCGVNSKCFCPGPALALDGLVGLRIETKFTKGPSIKYITLFLTKFDPLPCHTVTHPGTPKKSTSHISDPPFLLGLVQKTRTKAPVQILSQLFVGVFVRGSCVWKVLSGMVFVHSPFCQNTSVTTER